MEEKIFGKSQYNWKAGVKARKRSDKKFSVAIN